MSVCFFFAHYGRVLFPCLLQKSREECSIAGQPVLGKTVRQERASPSRGLPEPPCLFFSFSAPASYPHPLSGPLPRLRRPLPHLCSLQFSASPLLMRIDSSLSQHALGSRFSPQHHKEQNQSLFTNTVWDPHRTQTWQRRWAL